MLSRWLTRAGQRRHAQGVRGISRSRAALIDNEPVFVMSYPGSRVLLLAAPDRGNDLSPQVTMALEEKLRQYSTNESVSAVFFASRSPDVFSTSENSSTKANMQSLNSFVTALASFGKPSLAVYSGSMNGTGFAAFAGSKYLLGGPSLSLISNELSKGKLPSAGFAFQFTKCGKYGVYMARYLAVSQREVRADDLYKLGLLTHLVEDEAYVSLADALAHTIPSKSAVSKGSVVEADSLEELLDTMHVEENTLGDPLSHEAWDKFLLVPPNREDARPRDDELDDDNDLFNSRDDIMKCFNGTPEMAIKKLAEFNKPWALDAIDKISSVDRSLLNTWWKVTESISFTNAKLGDFLRIEASEAK